MSGRHTGIQQTHTVEGIDPQLHVAVHEPESDAGLRPVLLIHGFSSSSKLNWDDTGWVAALLNAGRRVITVDLPGHGLSGAPDERDAYSPSKIRADLLQAAVDAGARPLQAGNPASGLDVVGYSPGPGSRGNSGLPSRSWCTGWYWVGPTWPTRSPSSIWSPPRISWPTERPSPMSPLRGSSRWRCCCPATTFLPCSPSSKPSKTSRTIRPRPCRTSPSSWSPETRTKGWARCPNLLNWQPLPAPPWSSWCSPTGRTPTPSPAGPSRKPRSPFWRDRVAVRRCL
ncbi:alpha/beta fold hydrolase [Arthrobacter ulcerisalmonis]|uniref:alpha/beta fold hydrolase n=1 Tax=Arthrobacter ulcerisalmonis TaxID=2483813 RepID=UPI003636237D